MLQLVLVINKNGRQLIPIIQRFVGWEWVFACLAIGPILGIASMFQYKRHEMNHVKGTIGQ
nr:hypothetical protein [Neobacillus sp. 179.-C4.2 HS]